MNQRPLVSGFSSYNARQVIPNESSFESATTNVFSGLSDLEKLSQVRERAIYDPNALTYPPLASSGSGVIFPGAVESKAVVESGLRVRPTTFKGRQQLDISYDNTDTHFERRIHPLGWRENLSKHWSKPDKNAPFVGFPNPDFFSVYTDSIPTHNVQNLSHAQLVDALRSTAGGDFDHNEYLQSVGALLKSAAVPRGPAVANWQTVVQTDGGGVNGDPRLLEKIKSEYEQDFEKIKRIRIADATQDPRFAQDNPYLTYQAEQQAYAEQQETQFFEVQRMSGIPSTYQL